MSRPLRLEFAGALHHVMARGNARAAIVLEDVDRQLWVDALGRIADRFGWQVWAYCLMDNHYHLLVETPQADLSRGMRELNGVDTQAFNRRRARIGHVLQGRFKGLLVDKDAYLLELCRYVVLNPVGAGMVERAVDWPWSSQRAEMGRTRGFDALAVPPLLSLFGESSDLARRAYTRFVAQGVGADDSMDMVLNQVFLGSEGFVARVGDRAASSCDEVPKRQRQWRILSAIAASAGDRNAKICEA